MYRKLMMLLAVVAVLGLAIGLLGCPKAAPPRSTEPVERPGASLPWTGSKPPEEVEETGEAEETGEVEEVEEVEEEATGE